MPSAAGSQERIATRQRAVENAERELDRLDERENTLTATGRHPEQWIERDGRAAAEWALARHELDVRRELAVREAGERAVLEPPAHIRRTLGERPERDGPQRERWQQLARDLERYRLEHDIDVDRDGPVGPRPHRRDEHREQLIERIRGLRADRGLSIRGARPRARRRCAGARPRRLMVVAGDELTPIEVPTSRALVRRALGLVVVAAALALVVVSYGLPRRSPGVQSRVLVRLQNRARRRFLPERARHPSDQGDGGRGEGQVRHAS